MFPKPKQMRKIIVLLLCSSHLLTAHPIQADDFLHKELSPSEEKRAYIYTIVGTLLVSGNCGKMAVSHLPKDTHLVIKVAAFVPNALAALAIQILILQEEEEIIDVYKRHKWLLYLGDGTTAHQPLQC